MSPNLVVSILPPYIRTLWLNEQAYLVKVLLKNLLLASPAMVFPWLPEAVFLVVSDPSMNKL